ncbi:site-2 protease family protein [Patescibacteria group bacterium]|nr:site-2 protease family protein [Patescibacteria group bacterium]MBU4141791.1 site-2 protease family protein [Patescibacteria group bacterium]MBU4339133.1 site-2 protease family protein [Patescibacteria group bacterium]MBU4580618.1 site-2 protease family protein [Patescibacteria group bacterium]
MEDLNFIFQIAILVFSIVIHEVSHGAIAYWQGDPTAKYAGRLTLNPAPHIDPFGSIILPILMSLSGTGIIFGWAKPVPYNPYNLRDQKYGQGMVAAAGPASNLAVAVFFGIFMKILLSAGFYDPVFFNFLIYIIFINILLAVFNLVPIPPLDGSKILFTFLPDSAYRFKAALEQYGFYLLIFFIFFLFPVIMPIVRWIFNLIV